MLDSNNLVRITKLLESSNHKESNMRSLILALAFSMNTQAATIHVYDVDLANEFTFEGCRVFGMSLDNTSEANSEVIAYCKGHHVEENDPTPLSTPGVGELDYTYIVYGRYRYESANCRVVSVLYTQQPEPDMTISLECQRP
jgi:hypothetical protein